MLGRIWSPMLPRKIDFANEISDINFLWLHMVILGLKKKTYHLIFLILFINVIYLSVNSI